MSKVTNKARTFLRWNRDGGQDLVVTFPAGTPRKAISDYRSRVEANGGFAVEAGSASNG
ncbi:hypothetical protein ACIBUR_38635 [Streptomyces anulatus]